MEEKQETTEIPQEQITQEESREEKLDQNQDCNAKREDTTTTMPIINEEQELLADEKSVAERIPVETKTSDQGSKAQAGKTSGESKTVDTSKKPKPATKAQKQSFNKLKTTVPQPFSLATDKRMSRERRASIDLSSITTQKNMLKESQQKLSRSASLNHKLSQSSITTTRDLHKSNGKIIITKSMPKAPSAKLIKDKKTENAVKADDKAEAKEAQSRYRQQNVPKIATKSNPRPLPGVSCQRKEAATHDAESNKIEDKGKGKNRISKTAGDSGKGALCKLIRGTRKAFTTVSNSWH